MFHDHQFFYLVLADFYSPSKPSSLHTHFIFRSFSSLPLLSLHCLLDGRPDESRMLYLTPVSMIPLLLSLSILASSSADFRFDSTFRTFCATFSTFLPFFFAGVYQTSCRLLSHVVEAQVMLLYFTSWFSQARTRCLCCSMTAHSFALAFLVALGSFTSDHRLYLLHHEPLRQSRRHDDAEPSLRSLYTSFISSLPFYPYTAFLHTTGVLCYI